MVLKGLIFDTDGEVMSPTFTHGARGKVYRYYVSSHLQRGTLKDPGDEAIRRVPAGVIDALVTACVASLGASETQRLDEVLARVEVHPTTVQLTLRRNTFFKRRGDPASEVETLSRRLGPGERIEADPEDSSLVRVTVPCRMKFSGGRVWIEHPKGARDAGKTHPDPSLIRALQAGHRYLAEDSGVSLGRPECLPLARAPDSPYHRNLCRFAFLAPDIQAAILEGRQDSDLTLARLLATHLPPSWEDQRRLFAIAC